MTSPVDPRHAATVFPVVVPPGFEPSDSDGDGIDLRYDGSPCPCQEPPYQPRWGGGFRALRGKALHAAIDIMAAEGSTVLAPCDGYIPLEVSGVTMDGKRGPHAGAGEKEKAGNYFFLVSACGGWRWYGSHLRDAPLVSPGACVAAGTPIGYVGRTGNASVHRRVGIRGCPHLHLGLTANTARAARAAREAGIDTVNRRVDPVPILRGLYRKMYGER